MSFREFIWHSRRGRTYLLAAAIASLLIFIVFKYFYPYPNMVADSYLYIRPLVEGQEVNLFPMGYTWFLGLLSMVSRSASLLVWCQYLLLEASCLVFFFTVLYFFQTSWWTRVILFVFLFVNPLFLFAANFIMSDTLFTSLSLLWLTQMIWLFYRPRIYMIVIQALLLLLVFTVRYNALYYPLVAFFGLLLVRVPIFQKLAAIGLQMVLIGGFILYTQHQMKLATGLNQFSPFGGWRMANNALYMYGHVCLREERPFDVPPQFGRLDTLVRQYFYRVGNVDDQADPKSGGAFYGADPDAPLVRYRTERYGPDTIPLDIRKFSLVAPLYSAYGVCLIRQYPMAYFRWFLWPSLIRYFISPPEVFSTFTPFFLRGDFIGREASQWFRLTTLTVSPSLINWRGLVLSPFPQLHSLIHLAFIVGLAGFLIFGGMKKTDNYYTRVVLFIAAFWLCDLFFKVTAGAITLRHQLFLMILEFSFALLFLDYIYRHAMQENKPVGEPY